MEFNNNQNDVEIANKKARYDNDVMKLGTESKSIEFKLEEINETNKLIFAGLYLPKKSDENEQYENRTSQEIMKQFGHCNFDWIDIYPQSPDGNSGDIILYKLEKLLANNAFYRQKWYETIIKRTLEIKSYNFKPIIYICGEICRKEWKKMNEKNEKKIHDVLELYEFENTIVFYGQHPTAHLNFHGQRERTEIFGRNMQILNYLLQNNGDIVNVEQFITENEKLRKEKELECCNELFHTEEWPSLYEHLKNLPFEHDVLRQRISQSKLTNLKNSGYACRLINNSFWDKVLSHNTELFKTHAFCIRITNSQFEKIYYEVVKMENMKSLFLIESFCTHILREDFYNRFLDFYSKYDAKATHQLFYTSSFCTHISKREFYNRFLDFFNQHGAQATYQLFSTGVFCTHILDQDFYNRFLEFYNQNAAKVTYQLFSTGTFCTHILDPKFYNLFTYLNNIYGIKYTCRLFSTGPFCSHILNEGFYKRLILMNDKYDPKMVNRLFSTDAFCTHIENDGFYEIFQTLILKFGVDISFKLFSREGFCSHVEKQQFQNALLAMEITYVLKYENIINLFLNSSFCIHLAKDVTESITRFSFQNVFKLIIDEFGEEITVKIFKNAKLCQEITKKQYYKNVKHLLTNYSKLFQHLSESQNFAKGLMEYERFLPTVLKDYEIYNQVDIQKIYKNENYIANYNNIKFHNEFNRLLLTHFKEKDRVSLLQCSALTCRVGKYPKLESYIIHWKDKCKPFDIVQIFQCGSFCTRIQTCPDKLEQTFNDLILHFKQYEIVSKISSLQIAMFFVSVNSFNTHEDRQPKILKRFNDIVIQYSWDFAFTLFQCSTFLGRIHVDEYYEYLTKYISDGISYNIIIEKFTNTEFNKNLIIYDAFEQEMILKDTN